MSIYTRVHGSFQGGWTGEKFAPLRRAEGHKVVSPPLPGSADAPLPADQATLDRYVERICVLIDAEPQSVILVGHSMGGIVISQTAERRPDRIAQLVYICGFILADGESLLRFLDDSRDLAGEE